MITFDEALNATDPNLSEEERKASANRILEGVRANEIYWDSRPELEALRAQAEGHGVVVRGSDEEGGTPTGVGTGTAETPAGTIEGTATEEPVTALTPGGSVTPAVESPPPPAPDNPNEAIARLRAQIERAGGTPEA